MLLQQNFAQSFQSPVVRVLLVAIAIGLALRAVARSAEDSGKVADAHGHGVHRHGRAVDDHSAAAVLCEGARRFRNHIFWDFTSASALSPDSSSLRLLSHNLLSAPLWGRFSDRVGRRPTLLIALTASGIAYLIFGFADSLLLLFLSRIVQGAGGGTVGVIQAYVADSTAPQDRARALGWLSATTNLGVALGPVLGSFAIALGKRDLMPGPATLQMGHAAPGIFAAALCLINIAFAARYLTESRDLSEHAPVEGEVRRSSREAIWRVISHSKRTFVTPDLDLRHRNRRVSGKLLGPRSVSQCSLSGDRANDRLLLHVHRLDLRVYARAAARSDGRLAWRSKALASRTVASRRWCAGNAALTKPVDARDRRCPDSARNGVHVSLCDGAAVARDQSERTRALHGNAADVWRRSSNYCAALLWLVV